jgi:hypothetical protein
MSPVRAAASAFPKIDDIGFRVLADPLERGGDGGGGGGGGAEEERPRDAIDENVGIGGERERRRAAGAYGCAIAGAWQP